MKTYAGREFDVYEPSGQELRIHWNIQEVPAFGDAEGTQWEADEALCSIYDDRATLISKIIHSVYTLDDEIATINNQSTKPEQYEAYQAFRAQAKALADGWINRG